MIILSIRPCGTSIFLLHAVKSYDMGPSHFTSHAKEGVLRIFIALKNPSPWLGFNPQLLGPVARTLTTTPPRLLVKFSTSKSWDSDCGHRNRITTVTLVETGVNFPFVLLEKSFFRKSVSSFWASQKVLLTLNHRKHKLNSAEKISCRHQYHISPKSAQ
jgi:hypothetical protein